LSSYKQAVGVLMCLALVTLASAAQLWGHIHWLLHADDHCDFPGDCLDTFYPKVFWTIRVTWLFGVVLALVLVVGSLIAHAARPSVMRIAAVGAASFLSLFFTPVGHGPNERGWLNDGQPISLDTTYAVGLVLLLLAVLLASWELLDRLLWFLRGETVSRRSTGSAEAAADI
jgi:hypothetical protein